MKSNELQVNRFYWSKRHEKPCICDSYMGFMAYVVFLDKKDSGWYHCQELEEFDLAKRKINWRLYNHSHFYWHRPGASKSYLLLLEERRITKMRRTLFIKSEGRIWVPRPSSWLGGWARHSWLKRHFGKDAPLSIACPETWADLVVSGQPVKILVEQSNKFREEDYKKTPWQSHRNIV